VRHPVPVQQQERPLAPRLELARPLEPRHGPVDLPPLDDTQMTPQAAPKK